MKSVAVVSNHFAPGHASHLYAFYELFRELGYRPLLYVDPAYPRFFREDGFNGAYRTNEGLDAPPPDLALIFNLSEKDGTLLRRWKRANREMKVLFVYHEPWRGLFRLGSDLLHDRESLRGGIRTLGRRVYSFGVLRRTDLVLLASETAEAFYERYDGRRDPGHTLFPLIFADEYREGEAEPARDRFSFIATVDGTKAFPEYLHCVKGLSRRDPSMRFEIATRSDIRGFLDGELLALQKEGRLRIQHGRPLLNREIGEAYLRCACAWFAYNRSTQSGALCKAFMFGAPGIATGTGVFPQYIDGTNGIQIRSNTDLGEIYRAYCRILGDLAGFSCRARRTYLEAFDCGGKRGAFAAALKRVGIGG